MCSRETTTWQKSSQCLLRLPLHHQARYPRLLQGHLARPYVQALFFRLGHMPLSAVQARFINEGLSDSALNHGIIATQYWHIMKYVPTWRRSHRLTIVVDLQTLASKSRTWQLWTGGQWKGSFGDKCVKLTPTVGTVLLREETPAKLFFCN